MKTSYLTAGIKLGNLLRLLKRNPITFRPKYIGRILFLLQSAIWSSLFSTVEKLLLKKKIAATPVPEDPVFIIGHWRTGSTYLHQLLNIDPENAAPTLFQVAVPECFITGYYFYKPILSMVIDKHRPMDNVRLGMNEPQEDEYALYRMTGFSPLEKLIFPRTKNYFLLHETNFIPGGSARDKWEKKLLTFYQKLHFKTGKKIVSKNPFNSYRITELSRLFPNARFIHIVRNPIDVVPSTIHMWTIVQQQNALINNEYKPSIADISEVYAAMQEIITRDIERVPPDRKTEVRYEDLVSDPVLQIKKMYTALSLPFTQSFESKLKDYIKESTKFERNTFNISDEDKSYICRMFSIYMAKYGYH